MREELKKIALRLFSFIFIIFSILIFIDTKDLYAVESNDSILIKKVSKSYTNKFCNSIGFGLSKESAMNFSIKENNQVFNKKKGFNNINQELLAEEIAIEVIEKCGYPINLSGEKGILEFKSYYLSKIKASSTNEA
ncbi:hypothetical protein [Prochlorococcus sp. MIT 0916]|uniref:hypothetical protein n=1 Tax=Prochlorococcus sp. MIT 0916 TaxID=3082521 RepID=UPI0039B66E7F